MTVLTDTAGQSDLPRYFAQVFEMTRTMASGRVDIVLPDGRRFRNDTGKSGPVAELVVHDPDIFARLIREGDLGFCEGYVEGQWSSPDLMAFFDVIHEAGDDIYDGFPGMGLLRTYEKLRFWLYRNTRAQARRNIRSHYDLGNDFYALWLDETMTYSSALFEHGQQSLEDAQRAKYASVLDQMGAKPGDHILEIGCGWGGFAEYAAGERGMRVTGLTISPSQLEYARARIQKAGLSDRVDLKLQDYRDERGHYDGVASIEMFEAVGERYWPAYFETVRGRLKPGKRATLQIITVEDRRFKVYSRKPDFIQKYIFPGGMLPAPGILAEQVRRAGLRMARSIEFGESYSRTLRQWYETFNDRWDEVARLGFDERFRRMWNVYLTSCAAAFEAGTCDVCQITIERTA